MTMREESWKTGGAEARGRISDVWTTSRVNPLRLCDRGRRIRSVGVAYGRLVQQWDDILRSERLCLDTGRSLPCASDRPGTPRSVVL